MNNAAIELVIKKIAEDLLKVAHAVLSEIGSNHKTGHNTLKGSALDKDLSVIINKAQNPVISALFDNYVTFIEADRAPKQGKRPPISALKEWASKNGIPTDANTLWLISTAIWRDGHAGRPIFATMEKKIDKLFEDNWSNQLFAAITKDLDVFFNTSK